MAVSRQALHRSRDREALAPLVALGGLSLAMAAFVAAGPWIIARFDYAAFIPGVVLSGALTVAATRLAPGVPTRAGLTVILGLAAIMRLLVITAALLMVGMFALSPNYPWYFFAVVPFAVLGGGAPAWAMTLAAPLLYKPLILPNHDFAWKTLATLPFVIAVARALMLAHQPAHNQGASKWTT